MQVHFVSSGTRWHSFRNADLLAEVWHCLEHGEICSAVTIWRRHQVMLPAFQSLKTIDSEVSSNHQKNHLQKNHCNTIEVKSSTVPFCMQICCILLLATALQVQLAKDCTLKSLIWCLEPLF